MAGHRRRGRGGDAARHRERRRRRRRSGSGPAGARGRPRRGRTEKRSVKDPLEEAGSDVTRRGAGVSLLLVLLGLILLAILRPSTIDTLAIIFGIVALIMLHEAGHYFTAKRAGMKVTEFFLGFGPRVWSFRRGETEYGVKAIPAGGDGPIVGVSKLQHHPPDQGARTVPARPLRPRPPATPP